MAVRLFPRSEGERWLLAKAGYGRTASDQREYVLLTKIAGDCFQSSYDPYDWGCARTMTTAHNHILKNWDDLTSGQVICCEHLLGERSVPKISERLQTPEPIAQL